MAYVFKRVWSGGCTVDWRSFGLGLVVGYDGNFLMDCQIGPVYVWASYGW